MLEDSARFARILGDRIANSHGSLRILANLHGFSRIFANVHQS
jgi:hypothetical protein